MSFLVSDIQRGFCFINCIRQDSPIWDMFEVVSGMYLTTSFVRLFVLFDLTGNIRK